MGTKIKDNRLVKQRLLLRYHIIIASLRGAFATTLGFIDMSVHEAIRGKKGSRVRTRDICRGFSRPFYEEEIDSNGSKRKDGSYTLFNRLARPERRQIGRPDRSFYSEEDLSG